MINHGYIQLSYDIYHFSGNEYTGIYGSNSFDGNLTPYIHNIFKPDAKICILDGEMLLYHPETKTFGNWCFFSSPEHKVLKVSYCDHPVSGVRRQSSVVHRVSSTIHSKHISS